MLKMFLPTGMGDYHGKHMYEYASIVPALSPFAAKYIPHIEGVLALGFRVIIPDLASVSGRALPKLAHHAGSR